MRGKLGETIEEIFVNRITPAYAGKTFKFARCQYN